MTSHAARRACEHAETPTSKAFTSEETPDDPIVVPPRAPLPEGVPNYVTARGLMLLRDELADVERERNALGDAPLADFERERRRKVLAAKIAALTGRIASAELVDPRRQARDQVRFGATVTVRDAAGECACYTIVGVDEAAPAEGRIAFLAPLARVLTGLGVGDTAQLRTGQGIRELVVESIAYDEPPMP